MNSIVKKLSSVGKVVSAIIVCGCAVNAMAATLTSKSYMEGETVYHTTNGVIVMSGWTLPEGTTVRLSAQGDKEFLRWVGDVPEGVDATNREIDVMLGTEDLKITPLYSKMWVVDNLAIKSGNTQTGMIYCVERGVTNWAMTAEVMDKNKKYLQAGVSSWALKTVIAGEMDLSTPVIDLSGNFWKITRLGQDCLCTTDKKNTLTTSFIAPRTLLDVNSQAFNNGSHTALTNMVFDCPEATGATGDAWLKGCPNLKSLTLKLPKLTAINNSSFADIKLDNMNASEWDFSSVTKFTKPSWINWAFGFNGKKITGTIRLPKMETLRAKNFYDTPNLYAAELGTDGNTLKNLSTNAFGGTCGIKSITIGGAEGWIAATNSVTFKNGLAQVIFLSTPPTIPDGGTFVNETDTEALSVCFYIPKDNQSVWNEVTNKIVRAATDDEIATFCDAHPDAEPPVSVVDVGTLGSKYQQFVGWSVPATTKVVCEVGDPRFGGSVTVEPNNKKFFKPYEEVTLIANPAEGTTFTRWTGLPTGVTNCYDSTITFKVGDKPLEITMWAGPNWTYVAEDNMITNKIWKLNAYEISDTTLRVGSDAFYSGYTGYGEGVLDLSGKIYDANIPEKEWAITEFGDGVFHSRPSYDKYGAHVNTNMAIEVMTALVIPRTLLKVKGQWINCNAGGSVLKTIVLDAPHYEGSFSSYTFNQRNGITSATLNLPGLTSLNGSSAFVCSASKSNVDMWNLSGLKTIATSSFVISGVTSGTLHLESLTDVNAIALASKKVTGYEFGTGYDKGSNAKLSLAHCALSNNVNLVSIKFGPYSEINLADDTAFVKCTALRKIVFEGKPIAMNVIDNLLCEAAPLTEQTEPVIIYASAALGWNKIERFVAFKDLTEEEKALKPVELDEESAKVIGAFKCADESKRAWIVNYRSRFDPKGTIIIIR